MLGLTRRVFVRMKDGIMVFIWCIQDMVNCCEREFDWNLFSSLDTSSSQSRKIVTSKQSIFLGLLASGSWSDFITSTSARKRRKSQVCWIKSWPNSKCCSHYKAMSCLCGTCCSTIQFLFYFILLLKFFLFNQYMGCLTFLWYTSQPSAFHFVVNLSFLLIFLYFIIFFL